MHVADLVVARSIIGCAALQVIHQLEMLIGLLETVMNIFVII